MRLLKKSALFKKFSENSLILWMGILSAKSLGFIIYIKKIGTDPIDTTSQKATIQLRRNKKKISNLSFFVSNDSNCLDAEFFKVVADKLILENGVRPILHCYAVDVIIENNIIKGIITESKSGRKAIIAKRVIDCTGDADICFMAGVDCKINNEKD